jgi:hypothetical protein
VAVELLPVAVLLLVQVDQVVPVAVVLEAAIQVV